ncbi:hypothetical protein R3P38DRAFT_2765126 [Favolaschia claudopus]|uniref:Uncharacterized protein n=1 Tax=Favolaschia claudopus TaxID=2862362 RepID=A0AAW0D4V5_9AGAR
MRVHDLESGKRPVRLGYTVDEEGSEGNTVTAATPVQRTPSPCAMTKIESPLDRRRTPLSPSRPLPQISRPIPTPGAGKRTASASPLDTRREERSRRAPRWQQRGDERQAGSSRRAGFTAASSELRSDALNAHPTPRARTPEQQQHRRIFSFSVVSVSESIHPDKTRHDGRGVVSNEAGGRVHGEYCMEVQQRSHGGEQRVCRTLNARRGLLHRRDKAVALEEPSVVVVQNEAIGVQRNCYNERRIFLCGFHPRSFPALITPMTSLDELLSTMATVKSEKLSIAGGKEGRTGQGGLRKRSRGCMRRLMLGRQEHENRRTYKYGDTAGRMHDSQHESSSRRRRRRMGSDATDACRDEGGHASNGLVRPPASNIVTLLAVCVRDDEDTDRRYEFAEIEKSP